MQKNEVNLMKPLSIALSCFCILIHFSFSPVSGKGNAEKPNLILIVADDLGYADLGMHGSKQIPTPYIDQLAEEGIVFSNGYVSSPVCSPSRAGLLTGKNQVSFGFDNNLFPAQPGFDPDYVGLPLTETTLANKLKSLNYVTGLIGKWHLGEKAQFHPLNRGFDEFWGFLGGAHDYFISSPGGEGMQCPIECTYKTPEPISYISDDIGNECVDYIRRHKNEPFFLFASFNAPHSPMQAKEADLKLFKHIEDDLRRTYCAMVYRLDQNVGKILEVLQEEGLEHNTFVVFISDNGGPANAISNGSVNAPLRGQKTTLLEGGIRVPFIFKWPAQLTAGKKIDDLVLSLDICPTFVEAAGGTTSEKDNFRGINIIPFLTGQTDKIPHVSMEWSYTVSAAIREGDWKLISLPDRLPMLYHISDDISEQYDLSLQNLDRTKAMLKKLGEWDVHLPHPVFLEPADWRIRHLGFYDAEYQLVQPE
jgi:arylsulfatase A-like enzyme